MAEQGFLLFRRYIAHVAAFSFALLLFQGRTLLLHHLLEKARLFLFGGGKHGHGQAADKGRLSYGDQILRGPVQGQGGSEIVTEQEEHHRHQVHNNALGAFPRLRRHPHLDNHGYGHDERQNIDWNAEQVAHGIRQGKIRHPQAEGLPPQFCGILEHTVKGKENGNLDKHGDAAAGRVDAVFLVQLHHFHVHLLRVVRIFLLEFDHLRLNQGHAFHGHIGFFVQRPDESTDNDGHADDGHAPVAIRGRG